MSTCVESSGISREVYQTVLTASLRVSRTNDGPPEGGQYGEMKNPQHPWVTPEHEPDVHEEFQAL
jgi:hypothetical protein